MTDTTEAPDIKAMTPYPPSAAFQSGRAAYEAGKPETDNPYTVEIFNGWSLAKEWTRGYRNTRKWARFDATIKARREKADRA